MCPFSQARPAGDKRIFQFCFNRNSNKGISEQIYLWTEAATISSHQKSKVETVCDEGWNKFHNSHAVNKLFKEDYMIPRKRIYTPQRADGFSDPCRAQSLIHVDVRVWRTGKRETDSTKLSSTISHQHQNLKTSRRHNWPKDILKVFKWYQIVRYSLSFIHSFNINLWLLY